MGAVVFRPSFGAESDLKLNQFKNTIESQYPGALLVQNNLEFRITNAASLGIYEFARLLNQVEGCTWGTVVLNPEDKIFKMIPKFETPSSFSKSKCFDPKHLKKV